MSDENRLSDDVRGWRILGACFVALVATIGGCVTADGYNDNRAIVEMVGKGADPMVARCAIWQGEVSAVCALVAARK